MARLRETIARADWPLLVVVALMAVVAAGYPSYLSHPITLLAPIPLLVALLLIDRDRMVQPVWLFTVGALVIWCVLLYLAMDGTGYGLIHSVAMYAPFAALAFLLKRTRAVALVFAVLASALLGIRVLASWVGSGAELAPWTVYEGNDLAPRLVMLLPLVLVAWHSLPGDRRTARVGLVVVAALSVAGIVVTMQRAAFAVLAVLIVIWLARTKWQALAAIAAAGLVAFLLVRQPIMAALEQARFVDYKASSATRPEIWQTAINAWGDTSWLGVGPGNSDFALRSVDNVHAHNGLIQSGLEAGFLGAILFLGLVGYLLMLAFQLIRKGGQNTLWALPLLAYIGFSVFSAPLQRPDFTLVLVLAIFGARDRLVRDQPAGELAEAPQDVQWAR